MFSFLLFVEKGMDALSGSPIFHRLPGIPSASKVAKLLQTRHGAIQKTVDRRNNKDVPWVTVLHPTPVSFVSLDFMFRERIAEFSPFSLAFFDYLDQLKRAVELYFIGDFLADLKSAQPRLFEERRLLLRAIDDAQVLRLAVLAGEQFIAFFRIWSSLGVVPVAGRTIRRTGPWSIRLATNLLSTVLEDDVRTRIVLTWNGREYACSDYAGNPVPLLSFGKARLRTAVTELMQYEYQYRFAVARSTHHTVEKMTRTNIVVSSSLRKEVEHILDILRERADKAERAVTKQAISEASQLSRVQKTVIESAVAAAPEEEEEGDNVKQTVLDLNFAMEKKINRVLAERSFEEISDVVLERNTADIAGGPYRIESIAGPSNREVRESARALQERNTKQRLAKTSSALLEAKKELKVMKDEVIHLINENAKLEFEKRMKTDQATFLAKQNRFLEKERDRRDKTIARYSELADTMRAALSKALETATVSQAERDHLAALFTKSSPPPPSTTSDGGVVPPSSSPPGLEEVFELALSGLQIRFAVFFSQMIDVDTSNYWLREKWLHDRRIEEEGEERRNDTAGRKIVIKTPEFFMLDINPRSDDDKGIRDLIDKSNIPLSSQVLYERRFLNVQFPTQDNVNALMEQTLKAKWKFVTDTLFKIKTDRYTKSGQPLGPIITEDTISTYVDAFADQVLGCRPYSHTLSRFSAFLLRDMSDEEGAAASVAETAVAAFLRFSDLR